MRIAVDMDSTLAATAETAFKLMGRDARGYSYNDFKSWDWPLEEFGANRYLEAIWSAWTLRPTEVPLMEQFTPDWMHKLNEMWEQVDVVTAHPAGRGISDGKRDWLDYCGIEYDNLVQVDMDQTKADLDYDVYIDDKPALAERVNKIRPHAQVYMYDQPYNRDAPGDYHRIETLEEVV